MALCKRLNPCVRQPSTGLELRCERRCIRRGRCVGIHVADVDLKLQDVRLEQIQIGMWTYVIEMLPLTFDMIRNQILFRRVMHRCEKVAAGFLNILDPSCADGFEEREDFLAVLDALGGVDESNRPTLSMVAFERGRTSMATVDCCDLDRNAMSICEARVEP